MNQKQASKAASALGTRGGKANTAAQKRARAANGKLGGRPVRTRRIEGVEVHADAVPVGDGAFRARTPAAARWLERHGYVSSWPETPVAWRKS
ncbi:MAG TPA: hypothetical protein VGL61_14910 [Kofleriaceae bacterium]